MAATDQLTVRVGERVARAIPLVHSPFKIGRNPDNTLPLQHALVSREHAELTREAQGWTLIEGLVARAQPSGITTRHAWETLRDELLADVDDRLLQLDAH